MSLKAMVFIDGSWLYRSRTALFAKLGEENFEVDYARFPHILCTDLANAIDEDISLVRIQYFGTIPSSRSGFNTTKQRSFYDFLEKNCHYDIDIHEVDVGGDSRADDAWIAMSLASSMLFYAAMPAAYDVAILVCDDLIYAPALRRARDFGKRVQIVSLHTSNGEVPLPGQTLVDCARTSDFAPIFLDDHAEDMKLVRELRVRTCKQCGRAEKTTWAGADFFCSECRGKHRNG